MEVKKDSEITLLTQEDVNNKNENDLSIFTRDDVAGMDSSEMRKALEKLITEKDLKSSVVTDRENYPTNTPDLETCKKLDELFDKNQLPSRKVQYGVGLSSTGVFDEYSYGGRKFVRLESSVDQDVSFSNGEKIVKNKHYWFEVVSIASMFEYDEKPSTGMKR